MNDTKENVTNEAAEIKRPDWFYTLNEKQQQAHLREWNKEIPPVYSPKWFALFWSGKRTLFYAVLSFGVFILVPLKVLMNIFSSNIMVLVIFFPVYILACIFHWVSVWRCSYNSTKSWKYFGRIFFVIISISLFVLAIWAGIAKAVA